jgi:tight adherence protein B
MSPTVAGLLVAVGLGGLALLVLLPRPVRVELVDPTLDPDARPAAQAASATVRLGALLLRVTGTGRRVERALLGAGIRTPAPEYVMRLLAAIVVALVLGSALGGGALGLVLVVLVPAVALLRVSRRRGARADAFAEQLPTTLQTLVASLRAGYSLPQALDTITESGSSPTDEEFERMLVEVRVGRPLGDALLDLGARMRSDDFDWVVTALEINREVGGDLSEVLETVERTIRERESLRRNIRTLSAEGRVSAVIIFLLPIITLGLVTITNPAYVRIFMTERLGIIMASIAVALMIIGGLWLRAMVKVRL